MKKFSCDDTFFQIYDFRRSGEVYQAFYSIKNHNYEKEIPPTYQPGSQK